MTGTLPPGQLRRLSDVLRRLAADLTARADELDGTDESQGSRR
ncbi:MAG: hypothetical protein ACRDSE_05640 [Pseudonocardiaceae bacterium]